uniref:Peptidase S1 domain-containing protein n=1 Tax=Amphilophus citrinellus TaxID=61819 RepID=A0A3Q0S6V0_AMPCI
TMHALREFLLIHALTCLMQHGKISKSALGSEIIKGKIAKEKAMQYMASVQNNNLHKCGGFLVSEDFVMTAAHCADKNPTSVVLGTHNLTKVDKKMRYGIQKMCKHPSFKSGSFANDIMLLKLSRKVRLGNEKTIKLIQLPIQKINLKENKMCSVAGWGATETKGKNSNELQVVSVPIINMKKCQKLWDNRALKNVICAGGYNTKNGICQGDSGGPLVCNKLPLGIVSFNNNNSCNYPNIPNVYTDVSKFLPWIKDILKKKKCKV